MDALVVIQWLLNLGLICAVIVLAARVARKSSEDPRMSRGLQLLTSKLAVLEDLSDRTDTQVKQMITLLEHKIREVQSKVELADQHVNLIKTNMQKSLEVAKIFQDRIPHEEIVERQNSMRYIQAARLAHQGESATSISEKLNLPMAEAELIVKVNKDQLSFSEANLPGWAQQESTSADNVAYPTDSHSATSDGQLNAQMNAQMNSQSVFVVNPAASPTKPSREHLVEELQKVQWQLERLEKVEATRTRNFDQVFESPRPPAESTQKLAQELKKMNETDRQNLVNARKLSQELAKSAEASSGIRVVQFPKIDMPSRN